MPDECFHPRLAPRTFLDCAGGGSGWVWLKPIRHKLGGAPHPVIVTIRTIRDDN